MINSLYIYRTDKLDPFENLAREQVLLEDGPPFGVVLYLWQNERTVVIGRNQNAFKECRVSLLEEEGGRLARRLSGGGAVFHDKGNLNFTFVLPRSEFNVGRQTEVICRACRAFGIPATISGRNDLTVDGKKFSGNAFYKSGDRAYHHGTVLMNADKELVGRYLNPPTAKLKAKGVDSVRSRVINLCEIAPEISRDGLCRELINAAREVYGLPAKELRFSQKMEEKTKLLTERYASKEWRFGSDTQATFNCEQTFLWGTVTLELTVDKGVIVHAAVFTDAMEWQLSECLKNALEGLSFSRAAMLDGVAGADLRPEIRDDLCRMLAQQEI